MGPEEKRRKVLANSAPIQARTIYGIDVDKLTYRKGNGLEKVSPAGDLSGQWWDEEKQEMK
jgi:hypothetical protein